MTNDHYTFGDDDRAARRLRLLAATYEARSAALLRRFADARPEHAIDLGAGLGLTTRLVHAITGARATTGIDASPRYLAQARAEAPEGVRYVEHDVARPPLPCPPAELIYARFLLTHLRDPGGALAAWRDAATPDGALLLEEMTALDSAHPPLRRYYAIVEAMQRHYGQAMYVGQTLGAIAARAGWTVVHDAEELSHVPAARMARLHVENLRTWRRDPFARDHVASDELDGLEARLAAIAEGTEDAPPVRVGTRQVVARR